MSCPFHQPRISGMCNAPLLGVEGGDVSVYCLLRDMAQRHEAMRFKGNPWMRLIEAQWSRYGVEWVPIDPSRPPRGYQ
jgi:hypothetical protein